MAAIGTSAVGLRIFGRDLEPDEVSRLLGVEPTKSARRGDVRTTPTREYTHREGSWLLNANDRSPGDLSGQIVEILQRLTTDTSIWRTLSSRYKCDIFCGLFMDGGNEGEELSLKAISMMAERGLTLGLCLYLPDSD